MTDTETAAAGGPTSTAPGPATRISAEVRAGRLSPVQAVTESLDRIARYDGDLQAFQTVRTADALAEAESLTSRQDLADLPLAGVPVAIKDNVPVEGEVMHAGSEVFDPHPQSRDHEVVRRLREAGAVVVGLTRVPEASLWEATDSPTAITRSPWASDYTAGGSSGGSAAAVASGMVPVAHGNDGLGSIRIPAMACGLVGIKPGRGVVPAESAEQADWYGMSENGPLATSVDDLALTLSVMADRPEWAQVTEPVHVLRVAASLRTPLPGGMVDGEHKRAVYRLAGLLRREGWVTERADPPYPVATPAMVMMRWWASAANVADHLGDDAGLQPRTRTHARLGRWVRGMIDERQVDPMREQAERFFDGYDLLLTPVNALPPLRAERWSARSWPANAWANVMAHGGFTGVWNFLGYPAMSVPFGTHPTTGTPVGVQLVGPPGSEPLLLGVARVVERLAPWPRLAPGYSD